MAPVFPTTIALIGDAFPRMTGTAIGVAITASWIGLAVSSRVIGSIAAGDPARLKKALLLLPAMSLAMIAVNLLLFVKTQSIVALLDHTIPPQTFIFSLRREVR